MSHPSRVNKLKSELLWQQDLILWKKKLTELENLHIIPCVIILWRGSGPYATKFGHAATNRSSCFITLARCVAKAVTAPWGTWEPVSQLTSQLSLCDSASQTVSSPRTSNIWVTFRTFPDSFSSFWNHSVQKTDEYWSVEWNVVLSGRILLTFRKKSTACDFMIGGWTKRQARSILKMQIVHSSKMCVNFYQSARCLIREDTV